MISISRELAASASLSIELWYFLAVVVLCSLFTVVTYWLVHANKSLIKRVERMIEEEKKKREEEQRDLKVMKTGIEKDIINLRFLMLQDFRRYAETIRIIDVEAREYLKSLGDELMSQMEEREHPTGQSQIEKRPQIDGKKSLKKGLEIQKEFTSEYELTHTKTLNTR